MIQTWTWWQFWILFESESEWQGIPVFKDKADLAGFEADVWVDFTTPAVAYENTRFALENGFAPVVGNDWFSRVKKLQS
ncbi:hypothetical protein AK83_03255 [Streptococcus pneumoniae K2527]|nr:hypothetical protein AK83_03255 [Streptococcus pneumoniae K2527]